MSASLSLHRLFMRFGRGLIESFVWLLLFGYFSFTAISPSLALAQVALMYLLAQIVTALATPYVARNVRHGMKYNMAWGVYCLCAAYIWLGVLMQGIYPGQPGLSIALFAILYGLYRALYRIPYVVESHAVENRRAGFLSDLLFALAPLLGGFVLIGSLMIPGLSAMPTAAVLLFSATACLLVSIVPLAFVPDVYERFSWGYRETFQNVFASENASHLRRAFLSGMESAALFLFWPIAVFLILYGSFAEVGIVLSITLLLALVCRGWLRNTLRALGIGRSKTVDAVLVASGWLLRPFAGAAPSVVLIDSYGYVGAPAGSASEAPLHGHSADGGTYIDEYTALKEIGLALGRMIMCGLAIFIAVFASLPIVLVSVFILAAIAAGLNVIL